MEFRTTSWVIVLLASCATVAGTPSAVRGQGTTASIQGIITDDTGPLPGATIAARDSQSGFAYEAVSDGQGSFSLGGLRPGTYEITVGMSQYKPQTQKVQLLLGQNVTVNFKIGPDVMYTESVQVVGSSRLVETP
jgi:hypothetical protein